MPIVDRRPASRAVGLLAAPRQCAAGRRHRRASPGRPASTASSPVATNQALVKRYCVSCHNERQRAAGLSPLALDTLDFDHVSARAEVWEKVLQRLRSRSMPPAGVSRPDASSYDALAGWLETELDRAAALSPNPGEQPALHRLNRAEYKNAVRDLLALDHLPRELDIAAMLPPDDASYGFDNIADALGTTPTLLESYLSAAQKISALAVGDRSLPVIVDRYRMPLALPQDDRFDDLPFGSRGGMSVRRFFPLDGEYTIQLALNAGRTTDPHQLEVAIDGERVQVFAVGGEGGGRGRGRGGAPADGTMASAGPAPLQIRPSVKAGIACRVGGVRQEDGGTGRGCADSVQTLRPGRIAAATVADECHHQRSVQRQRSRRHAEPPPDFRLPAGGAERRSGLCREDPLDAGAPRLPASEHRRRSAGAAAVLSRRAEPRAASTAAFSGRSSDCSSARSSCFASSASRRTARARRVSRRSRRRRSMSGVSAISSWRRGCRSSCGAAFRTTNCSISPAAASSADPAMLDRQVRRMLADPRAAALSDNFAAQWLSLRNLGRCQSRSAAVSRLRRRPAPRAAARNRAVLREHRAREPQRARSADRRLHLRQRAAGQALRHPECLRRQFPARHPAARRRARGLLGQGSILTVTSYAHRTSPVLRGKWILENLLGTPPPPPPPNVPALVENERRRPARR